MQSAFHFLIDSFIENKVSLSDDFLNAAVAARLKTYLPYTSSI